jgi:multicomponent Na+:H+ antiporter subunit C
MTNLLVAVMTGILFATSTYLLLRREPAKLLLGMNLLSYAVNVLLFSAGRFRGGVPPVISDKETFAGDIAPYVDPLPQALILTAIVISFGIMAFLVALVNRRNQVVEEYQAAHPGEMVIVNDPFGAIGHHHSEHDSDPEDYEWLEDSYVGAPRQAKRG